MKNDDDLYNDTYKLKNMYEVNEYVVLNLDKRSVITDGEFIFDLGKYSDVKKVLVMNSEIYIVVNNDYARKLIRLKDLDVLIEDRRAYGIFKVNEKYVSVLSDNGPKRLFDIEKREYLKGYKDYNYEFMLSDNLIVYENKDYKHRHMVILDINGELVFDCGAMFPYYVNGNLILIDRNDEKIEITHDLLGYRDRSSVIEHAGIVIAKPQYYKGHFVVVTENYVIILDDNLIAVKSILCSVEGVVTDTTIEKDTLLLRVKKDDKYHTVAVGLKNDFILKYDAIELLPYWTDERRTIKAWNRIDDNVSNFILYDEEGNFLVEQVAVDAHIIESEKNNLFIFYHVDGTCRQKVYNIDTKKMGDIPWSDVKFKTTHKLTYDEYCYGYNIDTDSVDIMDENLNVVFANLKFDELNMRGYLDDFMFFVANEFLCLIKHVPDGPRSYYRYILLDKEGKIYYNQIGIYITKIGSYIQVQDMGNLIYINSVTKEVLKKKPLIDDKMLIPENIRIDNGNVKLLRKEITQK